MQQILNRSRFWEPPADWRKITTLEVHTAGEPLRIFISGYPELPGNTILERRQAALEKFDFLRMIAMWEPRGHADMYGCVITPPVSPEADFGVVFMHNEGYSSMCGHGIIAVTTAVLETGILTASEPYTTVRIDTPAGLITARARVAEDRVKSVKFLNVPSFVYGLDQTIDVPGLGEIRYDLAFGGAYYAFVPASAVGLTCDPDEFSQLVDCGMRIKRAIMADRKIEHPFEPDLGFLYGTIFTAPARNDATDSRNVCIFADGEVDRSPTGTGVAGRLAILHTRDEVAIDQPFVVESILGTKFTGTIVKETTFGPHKAVLPTVEGQAFITGRNEMLIDPADPLKLGFILR
ncbi:MAG: proline racemase family protein [Candidatus Neomarinimicrobiota bacterium]